MFTLLKYTSGVSVLIPFIFCIVRFYSLDRSFRILFFYVFFSAITELIAFFLHKNNVPTYFLYFIFAIVEFTAFLFIYRERIKSAKFEILTRILLFGYYLLSVFIVFKRTYTIQDNLLSTVEAACMIVLSVIFIYNQMFELKSPDQSQSAFTWIVAAILLYFSITFFLFLFNWYIVANGLSAFNNLYWLNWVANIIFNILLTIGICQINRQ